MKRSKSYTWLSGLLRPRDPPSDPLRDPPHDPPPPAEEWGAAAWVHADATQPASKVCIDPSTRWQLEQMFVTCHQNSGFEQRTCSAGLTALRCYRTTIEQYGWAPGSY